MTHGHVQCFHGIDGYVHALLWLTQWHRYHEDVWKGRFQGDL